MIYLAQLVIRVGGIAATVLGLRYYSHMLQLASYQFQGYFRVFKKNKKLDLHGALLISFMIFLIVIQHGLLNDLTLFIIFCLWAVMMVCSIIIYLPKPAKKKFVVTSRVKRLFVTYVILVVLIALFQGYALGGKGSFLELLNFALTYGTVTIVGILPFIPALANLINKPIEARINKYYVDDAKRLLREHPNLRIIGITGSFGKTSVKYYLTTLLSEGFSVLMTPESYNTPMGIVRTIREHLKPTHEIFVCEMGARHLHDIKEITDIVHPDDGILTSIGHQHLETFHSLENIVSTKYELLDAVDEKGKADGHPDRHLKFVNGDNEIIRANMKYQDAVTYGLSEGNDYRATDIKVTSGGTSFVVTSPNGETCDFTTKLVGRHNVENIVGAIAAANSFGIPLAKLRIAVRRLASVPHRLELTKHGNVSILDDAYNSNPNGAKVALETLSLFENTVKILVTPGMVELGEKEDEYNKEFGRQAAAVCDYIITVGEKNSASIKAGALEAGFDPERLFVKSTLNEATALMYEIDAGREKVILLENDLPDNYK